MHDAWMPNKDMIPCDICGKMFERDECIGETCDECCAAPLTTEALLASEMIFRLEASFAEIERLKHLQRAAWETDTIKRLEEANTRLRKALESIARNTCCDKCQEAALVARTALKEVE